MALGAALAGCLAIETEAALVGATGYTNDFSTLPPVGDWSQSGVPASGGAPGNITTVAGLDTSVQTMTAASINQVLVSDTGNAPAANRGGVWSSTGLYLQTRPTGPDWTAVMATLQNNTGSEAGSVTISYDFAKTVVVAEEVEGHRVFYSQSGAANSWILIPALSSAAAGRVTATLTFAWPSGGTLYLLWADENGSPSPDTACQIDNFSVTATSTAQTPVAITSSPTNQTVAEGLPAVFTVGASGNPAPTYQWYRDGNLINGATHSVYEIVAVSGSNSNVQFFATAANLASNVAYTATSSVAVLTVTPDLVAPRLLGVVPSAQNQVVVQFSEKLALASVINLANYSITSSASSLTISNVALDVSQSNLTLTVSAMTTGLVYTLTVNGVTDQASALNQIATNSQATFIFQPFVSVNIGGAAIAGSLTAQGNRFEMTASGTGIGGTSDQFFLAYQSQTGDFDVKVQVPRLTAADAFTQAGLMARATLDVSSPYAMALATPGQAGCLFQSRSVASGATTTTGSFPVNYPYTWLRLQRVGNLFTGYASMDGNTWTVLGSVTMTMPASVCLGLAGSSHNSSLAAAAQFLDFGSVSGGTIGATPLLREPIGPCSRKTGFVISEILYNPAGSPGFATTTEFIEVYNSSPYFEDLSGYRLSGAVDYTFPAGTVMQANATLVVARNPAAVQSAYGLSGVLGPWTGAATNGLPNAGTLRLRSPANAVLLEINYTDSRPWPEGATGTGHSIVLARPSYGEGDPRAWALSDAVGGGPGAADGFSGWPLRNVVINEFLAHSDGPLLDYIELYNHSTQAVNVAGCTLSDAASTNKFTIPTGTIIPPRGFAVFYQDQVGFALSSSGEAIYFKSTSGNVLDVVKYDAQALDRSSGRFPDGAAEFYPLQAQTPGTNNSAIFVSDIVINEIMYSPISGQSDDEYVELYNRGTSSVDLGGWSFVAGINYTFPSSVVLAPDGYLVVAKNVTNLLTRYTNLTTENTFGDYGGTLANGGERLALAQPHLDYTTNSQGVVSTNTVHVVVNEVTFGDSGRWGNWSDGGGSSLELKDPHSDNRLAANWAESDETSKSTNLWTIINYTNVIGETLGSPINDRLQVFLLGLGECLVDDIEVRNVPGGADALGGTGGFEAGLGAWMLHGSHDFSTVENTGYNSAKSLHLRAGSRGDNGGNNIFSPALSPSASGTVNLRAKVRWLRGWPELLLRVRGGGLEVPAPLQVPPNLGSPGLRNSRAVPNAGPALWLVNHAPALPAASEAVVVTARASDPDGIAFLLLRYRVDPASAYTSVNMLDNGTGGDAVAGDGIYSATIPGAASGTLVAFYLQAVDSLGATNLFPQDVFPVPGLDRVFPMDSPTRECVVRWGDPQMPGTLPTYHWWVTTGTLNRWLPPSTGRMQLDNAGLDCTFVYNNCRVIYNARTLYAGSPWHRGQMTSPIGDNRTDYVLNFPADDMLLGSADFTVVTPGNPSGSTASDRSAQTEQTSYLLFKGIGVHYNYRRFVHVFVNGVQRSITSDLTGSFVMEDAQQPNGDTVAEWYPNDPDGQLFKIEDWFEFNDDATSFSNNDADLTRRTVTYNGVTALTTAPYRFMWRPRARGAGESASDYTNFFALVDAASPAADPNSAAITRLDALNAIANIEQWMRVFACQHTVGNWDSYGYNRGKNCFTYIGQQGKFEMMSWDIDFTMGVGGDGASTGLFGASDTRVTAMWNTPIYLRMYWRAYNDLINGPLNNSYLDPILDAKAAALAANNVTYDASYISTVKSFVTARRAYIASQIPTATFQITSGNPMTVANNLVTLTGNAPVQVKTILVNGVEYAVTWTSVTAWSLRLPVSAAVNSLVVEGRDLQGNLVSGATANVTVNYTGPVQSAQTNLVINEIMFNPLVPDAEYVEVFNRSTQFSFDLSNWQFNGLGYTFPPSSIITNRQYLVLVKDPIAFAAAYGSTNSVFGQYGGNLQLDGETLSLIKPGATTNLDQVIDRVRYDNAAPWPAATNGVSLQLIDAAQDNARVSNWAAAAPTPGRTNTIAGSVTPYPLLWINEVQPNNADGYQDNTGSPQPWVELFNSETNALLLDGFSLSATFTNLSQWSFPTGVVVGPSGFLVVFADGHPELSTGSVLHTSFLLGQASGSIALSRGAQILDYVNYTNMQAGFSYGSYPDGQLFDRQYFYVATPGASNNPTAVPVAINEWMASNTRTLVDPSTSKYEDWFELFNYSSATLDLSGYYLTDDLGNKNKWRIPPGTTLAAHSFLLCWADNDAAPGGTNTTGSALHTSFQLAKNGEALGLFDPEGLPVSTLTFGAQINDISQGRFPDGSASIISMTNATPGRANRLYANDPPVVAAIGDKTINAGLLLTFPVVAEDKDLPAQTLTYALAPGAPEGAAINPVSGVFTWSPVEAQGPATYPVTFRVTDNGTPNMSSTQTITITVTVGAANNPPVLASLLQRTVNELSLLWVTNSATDPDPGPQTLTFSLDAPVPDGLAIDPASGLISWTPSEVQGPGAYPVSVRVTDDGTPPLSDAKTFTIVVNEANTPPQLSFPNDWLVHAGEVVTFTAAATDADLPAQILTFSLRAGAPVGAAINPVSGLFTWTPPDAAGGTNVITVRVTDRGVPAAQTSLPLTVVVVPAAPSNATITPANPAVAVNSNLTLRATATGAGQLSYQWQYNGTNLPGAATSNNFTLVAAQFANAGLYSVIVANLGGSVTSAPVNLRVLAPPAFTLQPQSQSVWSSSNATFQAALSGDGPIFLQWTFNGTPLANATNATLTLSNVQPSQAGSYQVRATNLVATTLSDVATLLVTYPLTITAQPQGQAVFPYTNVAFAVTVSGSLPILYQWRLAGTNLPGATNATLALTNVLPAVAGTYTVRITNTISAVTSAPVLLTVFTNPLILTQPLGRSAAVGSNATFSVVATSTSPLRYQWFFNTNTTIVGATNDSLTYTNVQTSNYGFYTVRVFDSFGFTNSDAAQMADKLKPTITQQPTPTNSAILLGAPFAFSMSAVGPAPLSFRWRRGGTTVANITQNETNCVYSLPTGPFTNLSAPFTNWSAGFTNAGAYDVVVTNIAGNAPSSTRAYLTILEQLTNRTARLGSNVTFTFKACCAWPNAISPGGLRYQWFFNETNLVLSMTNPAAMILTVTNVTLNLTNVQATNEGTYTAVLTTTNGLNTSQSATLTLLRPPSITAQPTNLNVAAGSAAAFTVAATGTEPPSYQWWFNQTTLLAGATAPTLTLTNVQTLQAGGYSVVVSNSVGVVTSAVAQLTVTVSEPPQLGGVVGPPAPGGLLQFTFGGVAGQSYSVLWREFLDVGDWQPLTNISLLGANQPVLIQDATAGQTQRFYRVVMPMRQP